MINKYLLLLLLISLHFKVASTENKPITTEFKTYNCKMLGFSIQIPGDWVVKEDKRLPKIDISYIQNGQEYSFLNIGIPANNNGNAKLMCSKHKEERIGIPDVKSTEIDSLIDFPIKGIKYYYYYYINGTGQYAIKGMVMFVEGLISKDKCINVFGFDFVADFDKKADILWKSLKTFKKY